MQIFVNALSGAGVRIASMVIGFGMTPFVIHSLGLQNFGLFSIVGSLAGYLGLMDFGLGGSFVKFITEYTEQGRKAEARQVIAFGMTFYLLFGIAMAIPVYFFAPTLVHLFKMPPSEYPNAVKLFYVMYGLLICAMLSGLPGSTVVAMHRIDLASRNNFIGYLGNTAFVIVSLRSGMGLYGLVLAQFFQVILTATLQFVTARKLFGSLWYSPARVDRAIVRRLFSFSGWTQLNSVFNIMALDVGRFISASVVSVASVSYYELGSRVAFLSRSLPAYFLDAVLPAAAAADAHNDEESLDRMYRSGTLYQMFATFGIGGLIVGAADPLMRVWMGQDYPYVALVILWLAVGHAVNSATGVGTTIMRAAGMPKYEAFLTGISALANVIATVILAPKFGIVGIAMGTAVGWFAGSVYFVATYHRIRHLALWPAVISPAIRLCAAAAVSVLVLKAVTGIPLMHSLFVASRAFGLAGLAMAGIMYVALYASLTWIFGAWKFDDANLPHRLRSMGVRLRRRFA